MDEITREREALIARLEQSTQNEHEFKESLELAGEKSNTLEKLIAELRRCIGEKDESLEKLKEELIAANTVAEKVSVF